MDGVDLGTAVVTLAVGMFAVLPRVPALSSAGRAQALIQRDSELWAAMPLGAARDRLGSDIERRADELLLERSRDKTAENGWLFGTAQVAVAWVLLVASSAVNGEEAWAGYVRTGLGLCGLLAGAVGVFTLAATCVLLAVRGVAHARAWLRARRSPAELTYDI